MTFTHEDERHLAILDEMLTAPDRFIAEIEGVEDNTPADTAPEAVLAGMRREAHLLHDMAEAVQRAVTRIEQLFLAGEGAEDVRGAVLEETRLVVQGLSGKTPPPIRKDEE